MSGHQPFDPMKTEDVAILRAFIRAYRMRIRQLQDVLEANGLQDPGRPEEEEKR